MRKHIVCLGDSNTHGYCAEPWDCADGGIRFNEDERWTCLLQDMLGRDYLITEDGLSGRTTVFKDPIHEDMDAFSVINPILKAHEFVDLLIIMLGTNDTKERLNATAPVIGKGMELLVRKAYSVDCWGGKKPNVLIIAPPPIGDGFFDPFMGDGCVEKSRELAKWYDETAKLLGCHFLDAAFCEFNGTDHMHLNSKGHRQLAEKLAELIPTLI